MQAESPSFDVVVIGAGAGGICAAARLAHLGYRTLLVESLDRVGGRASTREVDGFQCNTGALIIEVDGAVAKTYEDLGLALDLHIPRRASTVLRANGKDINLSEGIGGWLRNTGPKAIAAMTGLIPWLAPKKGQSLSEWLNRFTRSPAVHGLIDNAVGAMFAANSTIFQADVFLHYFTKDTAFRKFGLPPGGTIEVWKPLVDLIASKGGEVWLDASVKALEFSATGLVNAVVIERGGRSTTVPCNVVVSNIGPLQTALLAEEAQFPRGYVQSVRDATHPAAIITVHFASRQPLAHFPGLALFAKTRRMVYAANFSAPELKRAPPGWHLYCGASVPRPPCGQFDVEKETALLLDDLREHFPGFDNARIVAVDVTAHEWPAQRAVTGYDLPSQTPVGNLWNVGDGVKPWGSGGTAACAEVARRVVEDIQVRFPLSLPASRLNVSASGEHEAVRM
ncbi:MULTISPECIES: NAD(P)/FAD-dependent oxidoreductase [Burkholderia]|uniref:Monomeric sarcosine oxidase n=1 Tax=Burkholderia aenigmatica TaxID=2015348 RepID=A0ABY6XRR8_9BURK|nr:MULTISPECIES: FAD-dependent oxidoreductase [Burkholderia]VWC70496.1 Monomeric sarcosine oxidase [Burkholderia aenigmatica]VWC94369.1 Monomeric sarcosine oxidase [Burkholderia aenigmatica]